MANSRSGGNANIDAKIMVPFTQASTLANLTSGENIKTSFGKISKFIDSIQDLVTLGTALTGAVDLNDYTSSGIYNNGNIASIANVPYGVDATTAFTLIVRNMQSKDNTSRILQFLIGVNPTVMWTRAKHGSSAFSSWGKVFPIKTSTTVQSGDGDPVTSDAVYQAISDFATFTELEDAIKALDVPASGTGAITGFGAGKTLASLTETDGKVNATFQDIDIVRSQVSDLFGVGTLLTSSNNLNSLSDGVYYYTGTSVPTNTPSGARSTLIQFSNTDASYSTQIVVPYAKTSMVFYVRRKSDDWGDWQTFECVANYDSTPTSGSVKAVQSGGLYTAFSNVNTALGSKLESSDVFGLGTQITTAGSFSGNLNNVKTAGCYYWTSTDIPTNAPYKGLVAANGAVENATLYVIANTYSGKFTQIVIPQGKVTTATGLYFRSNYGSDNASWEDWNYLQPTSKYDTAPTQDSASTCTSGGIYTALSGKQDSITFDGTYNSSTNPAATVSTVTTAVSGKQDTLSFDGTYDASTNKATTVSSIIDRVFSRGTTINSTNDLNNYTAPDYLGTYYWTANSVPSNSPIKNYKTGAASAGVSGRLIVLGGAMSGSAQYTIQIVFPVASVSYADRFYFRISTATSTPASWSEWSTIIDSYARSPMQIAATDDLDNILNPGKYYGSSKIHAPVGCPQTSNGTASYTLYVEKTNGTDGRLRQIMKPYIGYSTNSTGGNCIFERVRTSSWQKWIKYEGEQVEYLQTS